MGYTVKNKISTEETFEEFINRKSKTKDVCKKTQIRDITSKSISEKNSCYYVMNRVAFTYIEQSKTNKEKYFMFERWVRIKIIGIPYNKELKEGDVEYRICYYIMSRNPNSKRYGKWIFGESCPMLPIEDYNKLIKKAQEKKVII